MAISNPFTSSVPRQESFRLLPVWERQTALVQALAEKTACISEGRPGSFFHNAWKFLKHWHGFRKTLPAAVLVVKRAQCANLQWLRCNCREAWQSYLLTLFHVRPHQAHYLASGRSKLPVACPAGNTIYSTAVLWKACHVYKDQNSTRGCNNNRTSDTKHVNHRSAWQL